MLDNPRQTRRVVNVIHYPFFGGPQNQILRLREPLARMGWDSFAVLPKEPGNALGRLRAGGVAVIQLQLHRLRATPNPRLQLALPGGLVSDVSRLRGLFRRLRPSLVQINGLVNPQAAIAARLEHLPVVWQLLDSRPPPAVRTAFMPLVRGLADVVMSTGFSIARLHPGAVEFGERLVPFLPPVDTGEFRPDPAWRAEARRRLGFPIDAPVIGTVSNLTPMKGLEYFVAAAERLGAADPTACFAILGADMQTQGAYADSIRALASATGLVAAGRFVMKDPGADVSLYLNALDVFTITSLPRSEGVPTVVLEALSSGLPVVASDVGGLSEVVEHGETGFLYPSKGVDQLQRLVAYLLRHREFREGMGERARAAALSRLGLERTAQAHHRAYQLAIDHRQSVSAHARR
jgi:glycosyltransferase involved in cell wall biosynthesis